MKLILTVLAVILLVSSNPSSINAFGTTLPPLNAATNYRIFNDLMKQSLQMVPYQYIYGSIGRCWSANCNLNFTNSLANQYPANLASNIYAAAEIRFYGSSDSGLLNQNFTLTFSGAGKVGVVQSASGLNQNYSSGSGNTFILPSISSSLFVYIYNTTASNPVSNIQIALTSFGGAIPTFTTNFINYLQPFNILRTCFWQGQNLYNSGQATQTWANRPLTTSATQTSSFGVALEHILEL